MLKKLLSPGNYDKKVNMAVLFLRVASGAFMLTHGIPKLSRLLSGDPITFSDPIGLGVTMSFVLVIFAEFLCSIFLILGITTRFAVIPLIITMLVAGFIAQADNPFAAKEKVFLFLTMFITVFITGAGKFSVDSLIYKKFSL
jgi:putative oxidoreductase